MKTTLQSPLVRRWAMVLVLLSASLQTNAQLTYQLLYSFPSSGNEPRNPHAGLVEGKDGLLYGTAYAGGAFNQGAVYQMSLTGDLLSFASFDKTNGSRPESPLVPGPGGGLYGTSTDVDGYFLGRGTVFCYQPTNKLELQLAFRGTNFPVGSMPVAGLLATEDQTLIGTTYAGGTMHPFGRGTIFEWRTNGALTYYVLFGNTNGANPYSRIIRGSDGCFYGNTSSGGAGYVVTNQYLSSGYGAVYRMTPYGNLSVVYSFDGTNGCFPYGGFIQAADGLLYGTASYGGNGFSQPFPFAMRGNGIIFSLTTNGLFTSLHQFSGSDGARPMGDLALASDGVIYGTTYGNGVDNFGTVFRLTSNGAFATLVTFYGTNGAYPIGGVIQVADGSLYGTTSAGGDNGAGTVFRLIPPPTISSLAPSAGGMQLTWSAVSNVAYQVESASRLVIPDWSVLSSGLIATGTTASFTDPVTNLPSRYYRVGSPPN